MGGRWTGMAHHMKALLTFFLAVLVASSSAFAADFDNDAKSDIAVWRPSTGTWYVLRSADGGLTSKQWGLGSLGDNVVAGDYDGDGKTDFAVWRPSTGFWYILRSSDGGLTSQQWGDGSLGDVPVPGDYDGDGKTDIAVWRPSTGTWYIRRSSDGGMTSKQWGLGSLGDNVVIGDYDGDGKTDVAIWRPSTGFWYILRSSDGGMTSQQWGLGSLGDVAVPGDYDGDGKTDVAVWRPSTGFWYIQRSSDGGVTSQQWGLGSLGDVAVPGDYDGDGKVDVAVWRPSTGTWYILRSSDGGMTSRQWGLGSLGDVPVLAAAGLSPVRKNVYDVRDYFPMRPGDTSSRSDGNPSGSNTTLITVGTVRDSGIPVPLTLTKSIQRNGDVEENVFGFDPADGKMKIYGSYRGSPRVYYRNTPPIVLGSTSMRVGDSFGNTYTATNTNTGDNTTEFWNWVFKAVETVTTPAGTFDGCLKFSGVNTDPEWLWTNWFAPGIGLVSEITSIGSVSSVYYIHVDNTVYGTPPALTVSNVSGMYSLDVESSLTGNGGTRWQKGIYNLVHDNVTGALTVRRFYPDGTEVPRTGTLTGSAFTLSGMSTDASPVPVSSTGVFTPDGNNFVSQWWFDSAPDVKYGMVGELIRPVAPGNGDTDIYYAPTCNDNDYFSEIWTVPVTFGGFSTASRRDMYGVDTSTTWGRTEWDLFDSTGMYLLGNQEDNVLSGPYSPPVLMMPNRFTLGTTYENYDYGGGYTAQFSVDNVGSVTTPLGTFLSVRIRDIDNYSGGVNYNYSWISPSVFARLKGERTGSPCTQSLAWYQSNGASFGNRPTTVPFSLKFTNFAALYLRDDTTGGRSYFFDVQVQTPGGSMLTDNTTVQNIQIYAYPSMTEIPLSGSWNTWLGTYFYSDSDGAGANPPYPNPYSGVQGYLDVPIDTLSPGFYQAVVTDNTGQRQSNWLYYEPPTETGRVLSTSMSNVNNGDNTVTLSWALPTSPAPDPAKHTLRLYVYSTVDLNGDGSAEQLLMVTLPATATTYTIPATEVTRLKGFSPLRWYVQIREQDSWVTNPDGSTRTYYIYRNHGQSKLISGL